MRCTKRLDTLFFVLHEDAFLTQPPAMLSSLLLLCVVGPLSGVYGLPWNLPPNFRYRPEWDSLRVKWGLNIFSENNFRSLPRKVSDAHDSRFALLRDECQEIEQAKMEGRKSRAKFAGRRYWKNNDPSVVLIYDVNGYVAGMQTAIPKKILEKDGNIMKSIGVWKEDEKIMMQSKSHDESAKETLRRIRRQVQTSSTSPAASTSTHGSSTTSSGLSTTRLGSSTQSTSTQGSSTTPSGLSTTTLGLSTQSTSTHGSSTQSTSIQGSSTTPSGLSTTRLGLSTQSTSTLGSRTQSTMASSTSTQGTSTTPSGLSTTTLGLSTQPTGQSGTFTLLTGTPTHSTITPTHSTITPTHSTGTPTHSTGTPTHSTGTPTHSTGTPTHSTITPILFTGTPTHSTGTPMFTETPSMLTGTPTYSPGTPTPFTDTKTLFPATSSPIPGSSTTFHETRTHVSGTPINTPETSFTDPQGGSSTKNPEFSKDQIEELLKRPLLYPYVEDEEFLFYTVYFIKPERICNPERAQTVDEVEHFGTGSGFYMQNGTGVKSVIEIPRDEQKLQENHPWKAEKCFWTQGKIYSYNFHKDQDCKAQFPLLLNYNKGRLTGFSMLWKMDFSSPNLEHPDKGLLKYMFEKVPKCYYGIGRLTKLQIYLTNNFLSHRC